MTAEALVEVVPQSPLPDSLGSDGWADVDSLTSTGEYWEWLAPSVFARPSPALEELAREVGAARGADPLSTLHRLNGQLFARFAYSPNSTRVDSPIDDALSTRRGVCQDFSHILIALVRGLGVPCRYVSGYLSHREDAQDRSSDGASHAWVEALLPELGWVGFDSTNDLLAGGRHIRVAVGRDYADVPPTRGVLKGTSAVKSELAVAVTVGSARPVLTGEALPFVPWMSQAATTPVEDAGAAAQQ